MDAITPEEMRYIEAANKDRPHVINVARTSADPRTEPMLCCGLCFGLFDCPDADGRIEKRVINRCGHTLGSLCRMELIRRAERNRTATRCLYCQRVITEWQRSADASIAVQVFNVISPGAQRPTLWFRLSIDSWSGYLEFVPLDIDVGIEALPIHEEFSFRHWARYRVDKLPNGRPPTLIKRISNAHHGDTWAHEWPHPQHRYNYLMNYNTIMAQANLPQYIMLPAEGTIVTQDRTIRIRTTSHQASWPTYATRLRHRVIVVPLYHIEGITLDVFAFLGIVPPLSPPAVPPVAPQVVNIPLAIEIPVHAQPVEKKRVRRIIEMIVTQVLGAISRVPDLFVDVVQISLEVLYLSILVTEILRRDSENVCEICYRSIFVAMAGTITLKILGRLVDLIKRYR